MENNEAMRALLTAALYFGTFVALGLIAKRWMARRHVDLSEVRAQAASSRTTRWGYLLGFWHQQDPGS